MKGVGLTVIILIFALQIMAQQIVDSTKMWSSMQENCLQFGTSYTTNYHKFHGDTIINDTLYKKVWVSENENHDNWYFFGSFIREENKRVYYREMFQSEGLIYDFNLTIGDSVLLNNSRAIDNLWLTLAEIDSVQNTDGFVERWRLENTTYLDSDYWIIGIGSQAGVLNSGTPVFGGLCGASTLLCEKENNQIIYQEPLYETCFYELLIGIDDPKENKSILFEFIHKQDLGQLELRFNGNQVKTISIVSLSGRTIYKSSTNENLININTGKLPKGLYIISGTSEGIHQSRKFIR